MAAKQMATKVRRLGHGLGFLGEISGSFLHGQVRTIQARQQ